MTNVPTNVRKWTSLIWRLTWALSVSILVIAGLVIALIADTRANRVGSCVNNAVGDRNGVTSADSKAHIDEAKALQTFLAELTDPSRPNRMAAYQDFVKAQNRYVRILVADQAVRDKHPLGTC